MLFSYNHADNKTKMTSFAEKEKLRAQREPELLVRDQQTRTYKEAALRQRERAPGRTQKKTDRESEMKEFGFNLASLSQCESNWYNEIE